MGMEELCELYQVPGHSNKAVQSKRSNYPGQAGVISQMIDELGFVEDDSKGLRRGGIPQRLESDRSSDKWRKLPPSFQCWRARKTHSTHGCCFRMPQSPGSRRRLWWEGGGIQFAAHHPSGTAPRNSSV